MQATDGKDKSKKEKEIEKALTSDEREEQIRLAAYFTMDFERKMSWKSAVEQAGV